MNRPSAPARSAQQALFVPEGVIEGQRRPGLRALEQGEQMTGVLRPLHQDAVRLVGLQGPFQVEGAGGAVVPDGEVEAGGGQIKGYGHFRALLA